MKKRDINTYTQILIWIKINEILLLNFKARRALTISRYYTNVLSSKIMKPFPNSNIFFCCWHNLSVCCSFDAHPLDVEKNMALSEVANNKAPSVALCFFGVNHRQPNFAFLQKKGVPLKWMLRCRMRFCKWHVLTWR